MSACTVSDPERCDLWQGQPFSDELLRRTIPQFQWFVPVNFGNGVFARAASWPDAPLDWPHMGLAKFDYIVRRNLPDLQGKRLLDIGCNAGVISIQLARLGAAEVIGVDRDCAEPGTCTEGWHGWKEQTKFVKAALEWRCRTTYNVRYIESDMRDLPRLDLGCFDAVLALNCLYYLPEVDLKPLVRHIASITDYLVVQCNTKDHSQAVGRRATPAFMRDLLGDNGFPRVSIDHPWDRPWKRIWPQKYFRPVVVGRKETKRSS